MWRRSLCFLKPDLVQIKLIYNIHRIAPVLTNGTTNNLAKESEKQYLVKLKADPDHFGPQNETEPIDEGDLAEEAHFQDQPLPTQRLSTKKYADKIKEFIKQRKIKEALDYVEIKMIKEDRVKPENYIYNLLLGACGRVGYTKKAFMLYNIMKKRGLQITPGTYTALFNACSNSPWTSDGLTRAQHLREIMIEKSYEPNETNYNAMIKAFGRCGDLPTAFNLVDEMKSKSMPIKTDTINFLLQACISDKEAGFRHALLVWRKMLARKIAPDLFTFNLMLRCIRDCGFGNFEVMQDALDQILKNRPPIESGIKLLESKHEIENTELVSQDDCEKNITENYRPNLLARIAQLGNILSLTEVKEPQDRLLLVGGIKGFLETMEEHQIKPDFKTFNQLISIIPGNKQSENELMDVMKKYKIKPDLDFFNMLIKRRCLRVQYDEARQVMKLIESARFRPNLMTYGILAMACKTKNEGLALVEEMKFYSYTLNAEILGAMLKQACYHKDFPYVFEIMDLVISQKVKANKKLMGHLDGFKKDCKAMMDDKDNKQARLKSFIKGFLKFKEKYRTFQNEVVVDETEDAHPWQQYRQTSETDVRHFKDKSTRFPPRHTSRFRVKTSPKYNKL